MDFHAFFTGSCFDAYEYFGCHKTQEGFIFRVFAPNAYKISLIGEFSAWKDLPMKKVENGVYCAIVEDAHYGMMYKYKIYLNEMDFVEHLDPYGYSMELRPNFASIITDIDSYAFQDTEWIKNRDKSYTAPLNIYEMHLGSWKANPEDTKNHWYGYAKIGDLLLPYLKEHHYNAVEFMPLTEHPADISWGYQSTGFFSPTSRYGRPSDLQKLVDQLHQNNIKVIMDFVPVHFAIDYYALGRFDGSPIYEYPDDDMGISEWGSYNFNLSRGEVASFLKSSAHYWLEKYHFDGLRMDAISRIIYYQGNSDRGVNQNGLEFLKSMNQGLQNRHDNIILIAEDSSDFPKVTQMVENGGLGFDYKWDMGWMNDTLDFFKKTPDERVAVYHKLSFSMMYYYSERFLLPLSHDENVHGKATILQKMYGSYEDKFAQGRAFYMYMFTHPGKKLTFMGSELGHLREWDETKELDFLLLKYPIHDAFNRYMKDLHEMYRSHSCLYKGDYDPYGFKWLIVNDMQGVTYAYRRKSENQTLISVFNFSKNFHKDYQYKCEQKTMLKELLHSDWTIYGGSTEYTPNKIIKSLCVQKKETVLAYTDDFSTREEIDMPQEQADSCVNYTSYEHYIKVDLPPYSAITFELIL